jgi:hypothetical protein
VEPQCSLTKERDELDVSSRELFGSGVWRSRALVRVGDGGFPGMELDITSGLPRYRA